jgi:hypothetical protein
MVLLPYQQKSSKRSSKWPIDTDQLTFFPYKAWIDMHSEEHEYGEVGPGSHLLMEAHATY